MVEDKFTLEEIILIKSCNTKDKEKAIQILDSYLEDVDSEMAEIVQNTINKLKEIQDQKDFLELADYPI